MTSNSQTIKKQKAWLKALVPISSLIGWTRGMQGINPDSNFDGLAERSIEYITAAEKAMDFLTYEFMKLDERSPTDVVKESGGNCDDEGCPHYGTLHGHRMPVSPAVDELDIALKNFVKEHCYIGESKESEWRVNFVIEPDWTKDDLAEFMHPYLQQPTPDNTALMRGTVELPIYPFTLKYENDAYIIEFPDLPGCMSDGETIEQAIINGNDAVSGWIETAKHLGREIPKPENYRGG